MLNGITRPFFGWVSDNIGRENTMFVAFALEAVGIWALSQFGHDPVHVRDAERLVFFAWGEIYSLFPSTCTDVYGTQIRHDQCRPALHRQRHRLAAGAARQCAGGGDRRLACGVHRRGVDEPLAALMALAVLRPLRAAERRSRKAAVAAQ